MIIDSIGYAEHYAKLHPEFAAVFAALKKIGSDFSGRIEIDGEKAFINVSSYVNKPVADCRFEAHGKYIDIQYVVDGSELIDLADAAKLEITEDSLEKGDIAFYGDTNEFDRAYLTPGRFVIIFPGEAHRPCVAPDEKGVAVTKAVAKILL